jgi:flagellar hook-length control protein FliK
VGLVIQAPTDSTALAGITAAPADAPAPGNYVFAALLQALLGEVPANAADAPLDASPADASLPLPAGGSKEGAKADTPLGDALAAAVAALQLLPQVNLIEVVSVAPATGWAPVEAPAFADAHPLAAGLPAGLQPAATGHAGDDAAREAAPAAPAPRADVAHEAAVIATQPAGAASVAALAALEQAPATLAAAPHAKDVDKPPSADDPPPDEAGTAPAVTDQSSVVRFVGNANHQNPGNTGTPQDNSPRPGELEVHPRASAEGIAHASANSPVGQLRTDPAIAPTADIPPATPSAPEIPQPVHQVSRAVLEQVGRGDGEARIHLDPAELGAVTIRVKTEGDHVRVEVHAERAEAMNLLRDHSADLSSLLGSRGLNLTDVYVGLGGHGAHNSQGGDQQQRGERPANGQFAAILGAGEAPAIELHNRLRTAYNPDGAHSYLV